MIFLVVACIQTCATLAQRAGACNQGQGPRVHGMSTKKNLTSCSLWHQKVASWNQPRPALFCLLVVLQEKNVAPVIAPFWERAEFPHQLVSSLGALGLVRVLKGRQPSIHCFSMQS
jgi:hypothetical protein